VEEKLPQARGEINTPHKLTVLQQTERQHHHDDVKEALLSFGISSNKAQELIETYPPNLILEKLEFVEFLVFSNSSLVGRNPQGFLIKAITEGYLPIPPRGFKSRKQREEEKKKRHRRAKEIEQVEQNTPSPDTTVRPEPPTTTNPKDEDGHPSCLAKSSENPARRGVSIYLPDLAQE
jgi:hypothetical protein